MRLGIALPTEDAADQPAADGRRILRAESLAEGARRIEAAGFDSAWVFDSIGRGFLLPDPLICALRGSDGDEPDRAGHRRLADPA